MRFFLSLLLLIHSIASFELTSVWSNVGLLQQTNGLRKRPSFIASPTSIENGQDVLYTWQDVHDAKPSDFIATTCGRVYHGMNDTLYYAATNGKASGSIRLSDLQNMRCDYMISYVDGDSLSARSKVKVIMKKDLPHHGHLAFTSKVSEMAVSFTTMNEKDNMVQYGTTRLDKIQIGHFKSYAASDMCHDPATWNHQQYYRDPGYLQTVVLTELLPSTIYYYRFGGSTWSKVYSFRSRPAKTLDMNSTKFIAYADMGVGAAPKSESTATNVLREVLNGYDAFILHFGDISYARGQGFVWDKFMHLIEPIATKSPYMVSIGNHEYDHLVGGKNDPSQSPDNGFHPSWGNYGNDSNGECAVPMVNRFTVPDNGKSMFWYSFDTGGIHVIQMSTEHDWRKGSEQYEWLKQDLASVNRTITPWVILTAHRMMYATQLGAEQDMVVAKHFRVHIEDLLYEHKVNLVLVGHQHSYERSCPVYKEMCRETGTVHVVVGSAGATLQTEDFSSDYGNWSVVQAKEYGYLRMEATKLELIVQFMLNKNNEIYDEFKLNPW